MSCYRSVFLLVLLFELIAGTEIRAQDTTQKIVANRVNAPGIADRPYVILISMDGFRYDYADLYGATNLKKLSSGGVRGMGLRPGFPSLTFPNHYSIATGMYPAHHGIVDNYFYDSARTALYRANSAATIRDSSWYKAKPLWVLAEQAGMLSACFYWVGAEAAIEGVRPTYNFNYSTAIPADKRISIVQNWLNLPVSQRPHFICVYFSEVDNAGHLYGTDSPQLGTAVRYLDSIIGRLVTLVSETTVDANFIVVSDHGMINVDQADPMRVPAAVDTSRFLIPRGDALLHLYAKDKKDVRPLYRKLRATGSNHSVYLKRKLPARWHYGGKDDRYNRVGDLILVARPPKIFNVTYSPVDMGKHGFDPQLPEMRAVFYAWGPAFKAGITAPVIDNVHLFPMIAKILGLDYTHKTDGELRYLAPVLRKRP